jgi:hypothetical protein
MPLIAGFGGTVSFSGQSAVACKSITINMERDSLDVTQIGDYIQKRAAGRVRRSGSLSLYRTTTADTTLKSHMFPTSVATAVGATLTLSYTDQGSIAYASMNIHITSASITDDGSGAAMWELSWEEQG